MSNNTDACTQTRPPADVIDALWAELVAEVQRIQRVTEAEGTTVAMPPRTTHSLEEHEHAEHS